MLRGRKKHNIRANMRLFYLEELVLPDLLLRTIEAAEDYSFIHNICKYLYSPNNSRPAIDPKYYLGCCFLDIYMT